MQARSLWVLLSLWFVTASPAAPIGTAFSYQGELKRLGALANGAFDFRFQVFDLSSGGAPIAATVLLEDVGVVDGVFTVELDFGAMPFAGDQLWLGIGVRDGAATGAYTALLPRQKITAVPYALHAEFVAMNSVGSDEVDPSQVQLRIGAGCANGSSIRVVDAAGAVTCETDDVGLTMVTGADIVDASVTAADLATNSVGSDEIATNAVGSAEIATNAVGADEIATNAVGADEIAKSAVGSGEIAAGAVGSAHINNSQVQQRVLGTCPSGQGAVGVNADGSLRCGFPAFFSQRPTFVGVVLAGGVGISVGIGADGLPVISGSGGSELQVVKCNDPACSGGDETVSTVDNLGANQVGLSTSIAVGADGLPVISYQNQTLGTLKVAKCNDPACAGANETITTVDSASGVGEYSSIAIGADGLPVISYNNATLGTLKVAKCNDPACTGGNETITTVDSTSGVGLFNSIAIGADGFPAISYQDVTAGRLKVAKCNDPACAGANETITAVDSASPVGEHSSIAIGADGLPVISYQNLSLGTLIVAKCNDPACAGANETITTVDDPPVNQVGFFTSIAIGADGLPVISYGDSTAVTLKVAKCNDAACAGANETITTVNGPNVGGTYNSIAIGADGLPVIGYSDNPTGGLGVAKCGKQACN